MDTLVLVVHCLERVGHVGCEASALRGRLGHPSKGVCLRIFGVLIAVGRDHVYPRNVDGREVALHRLVPLVNNQFVLRTEPRAGFVLRAGQQHALVVEPPLGRNLPVPKLLFQDFLAHLLNFVDRRALASLVLNRRCCCWKCPLYL